MSAHGRACMHGVSWFLGQIRGSMVVPVQNGSACSRTHMEGVDRASLLLACIDKPMPHSERHFMAQHALAWPCMAEHGVAWLIHNNSWLSMHLHGSTLQHHAWHGMVLHGCQTWPCIAARHGHAWPILTLHGCITICMAWHAPRSTRHMSAPWLACLVAPPLPCTRLVFIVKGS